MKLKIEKAGRLKTKGAALLKNTMDYLDEYEIMGGGGIRCYYLVTG